MWLTWLSVTSINLQIDRRLKQQLSRLDRMLRANPTMGGELKVRGCGFDVGSNGWTNLSRSPRQRS